MPTDAALTVLQDQLNVLRQHYAQRLPERLEALATSWQTIRESESPIVLLPSLHRAVHSVAGSGTIYGFPAVSMAARTLEHFLHGLIEDGSPIHAEQAAQIAVFMSELCKASQRYDPDTLQLAFTSEAPRGPESPCTLSE